MFLMASKYREFVDGFRGSFSDSAAVIIFCHFKMNKEWLLKWKDRQHKDWLSVFCAIWKIQENPNVMPFLPSSCFHLFDASTHRLFLTHHIHIFCVYLTLQKNVFCEVSDSFFFKIINFHLQYTQQHLLYYSTSIFSFSCSSSVPIFKLNYLFNHLASS